MHQAAASWLANRTPWGRNLRVLEFGSRDINGTARDCFAASDLHEWIGVDRVAGPRVDVVGDAETIDLTASGPFDVVICTEMFEHTENWINVVYNAHHHLRTGGRLFVTCAGPLRLPHSAVDGLTLRPDEWYENVDPLSLIVALVATGFVDYTVEYLARSPSPDEPNGTYDTYALATK